MNNITKIVISGLCLTLIAENISAEQIKMRAREHFDFHNIMFSDGTNHNYSGLSNTINLWWEKPRNYSIGLAFNPILGSANTDDEVNGRLDEEDRLITLGVEGKYHHRYLMINLFSRVGLGASRLQGSGATGDVDGYHAYVGLGWEFNVKGVGVALEMAYRRSQLEQGVSIDSITPSIGVHFYR